MPLEKVGRYEIKSELGSGGMATVYRGYDPTFAREVAIKVISRQFLNDPTFRARFERETKTIAMLEHPGVLPVYDTGTQDNQPYIVMRLMTGGSLVERLKNQPLTLLDTVALINKLAPAIDYAHSKGVIHRDLKPANILFDSEGNPCIADFGIAKLAQQTSGMTGSSVLGTPHYMSPEQARGETEIDARADLYAFGIILYEMLTGQQPFTADSTFGVAMKHISEPVPRVLDQNSNLPPACQEILDVALAKERENRFSRAAEIAQRLEAVARGETVPPYVPQTINVPTPEPAPKPKTGPQKVEEFSLTSFKCPNCSAPIELTPDASSLKCAYCSVSILVPKELRLKVAGSAPRKTGGTGPLKLPTPPPPPLPSYKKPTLGAEASASLMVAILSLIVLIFFVSVSAGTDFNRLGVASLANALNTATPQVAAATAVTASPITATISFPTPTGATLLFDGSSVFQEPRALSFDGKGNVYVFDGKALQIFRLDVAGKRLNQWAIESKNNNAPRSLVADKFGNVYVTADNILFKYSGIPGVLFSRLTDTPYVDVSTFPDGSFVASTANDEVIRFNVNSQVIFRVSKAVSSRTNKAETQLRLAADPGGSFFVAGGENNVIVKYAPDGKFLVQFGAAGDGLGQFKAITGMAADSRNRLYISDAKGIQVFESDGKYVSLLRTNEPVSNLALNELGQLFGTIGNKVYKFAVTP